MKTPRSFIPLLLSLIAVVAMPASAATAAKHDGKTCCAQHEWLKKELIGRWQIAVLVWPGEGKEPIKSTGTADFKFILDGHFVQEDVKSNTKMGPFRGLGFSGYNPATNRIEATWMDNHCPGICYMTGHLDKQQRIITFTGTTHSCGGKPVPARATLRFVDSKTRVYEKFIQNGKNGTWNKIVQVTYTRR